ncbi:MAG: hypothetical protein QOK29_3645 [Rhodospirillaceae bacterium]|nr:hypothetical protein [Rhodospirillaceae bacterium]
MEKMRGESLMYSTSKLLRHALLAASVILVFAANAQAGAKKSGDGWTFEITPYLWIAGLNGTVGASERLPPADIDVSFSDIFSHLKFAAYVVAEARHERFGILADIEYAKLTADSSRFTPLGQAQLEVKSFNSTIEGAYRFVDTPSFMLDGLAGVRIFSVENQLSFGFLPNRSASSSNTWVDPVIGIRVIVPIRSGFFVNGYGDVGGFGISADWTWEIYGGVGYNFNDSITGYAGYRYLDVDHQDGGFIYDVSQRGPLIGVGFRF